jgi:UrcA family protein
MNTWKLTPRSTLLCATLATAAGLLGATDASALDAMRDTRSVMVNYGDVNLATLAGATTLYQRLEAAARSVCGERGHSFAEMRDWQACYQGAIDGAVASVNNPMLSALHRERSS